MSRYQRRRSGKDNSGPRPISGLFDRIRARLRPPQGAVIDVFRKVLETETGIKLSAGTIQYNPHTRTLSVSVSGAARSEITLRRKVILTQIRDELGAQHAPQHII